MIEIGFKRVIYPMKKKRLTREKQEEYLFNLQQDLSAATIKYSELIVTVEGRENLIEGTCMYVSNHQSVLDIPLIIGNVNTVIAAISKMEMKKVPILSYWIEEVGSVYIDRENGREGLKAILKGVERIKAGRSMLIFPEGTRNKLGHIQEFKKGSFKLAIKANVPVIPITVDGTYKGLEGEEKDLKAKIIFHKPIYIDSLTKEDKANLSERCKEIIEDSLIKQSIIL